MREEFRKLVKEYIVWLRGEVGEEVEVQCNDCYDEMRNRMSEEDEERLKELDEDEKENVFVEEWRNDSNWE